MKKTEPPKSSIEALRAAKVRQFDAARPDIVTRVNDGGKMTARQRVDALLDPDSAVEFGSIAAQSVDGEWIAEPGGVDFVGTAQGHPLITSSTDYTDRGGGYGAGRLGRLFATAYERRWPMVLFVDGGGSRARHARAGMGHIELSGPIGRFSLFDGPAELSGWVPMIAIVSGPAFAGHASLAGFSDFLISTPGSAIGMGGPPMVEAALGQKLSPNELAGAEMHEQKGGIDLLVKDEQTAIQAAIDYLKFYNEPVIAAVAPLNGDLNSSRADLHRVIDGIVDGGSFFPLRPGFAQAVVTGLARVAGRTVGILANDRQIQAGAINESAAVKIHRFVELCNAYGYPIISLVDSDQCLIENPEKDEKGHVPGLSRWHTRAIRAHQQRTVPLIAIQIGRGAGLVLPLMVGVSTSRGIPLAKLAWPEVTIGERDGFFAMVDHNAFDDVIEPGETRTRIVRLLRLLPTSLKPQNKQHWLDTW